MTEESIEPQDWPLRPWLLAGLLGLAGLLVYHIGGGEGPDTRVGWQAAVSAFLFFGPLVFALTLERDRWRAPFVFALIVGAVMAGLAWRAVGQADTLADPQYGFLAGLWRPRWRCRCSRRVFIARVGPHPIAPSTAMCGATRSAPRAASPSWAHPG